MSRYWRVRVPGGTYFFTVNLADRRAGTLVEDIDLLRAAWRVTMAELPVRCEAAVVLPDHLHAIWTLPEGDSDYSERWRRIKARFSRALGRHGPRSDSKVRQRECGIWQRRFWEHTIRDEADFRRHLVYCWSNPVRHGLVARPGDWVFSSFHDEVRAGRLSEDWAGEVTDGDYGERG